jgi:ribosomal silencing factor RsfS
LLDFGGVITHLFSGEKRRRYRLEEVWGQAHMVVRLQ